MKRHPRSSDVDTYMRRVDELLVDVDADDRARLLEDLEERLQDIPESDVIARMGEPETFVRTYLESAGLALDDPRAAVRRRIATTVSFLALLGASLVAISFGAQLILGPVVLLAGWVFARVSPSWLRVSWAVIAGIIAGEFLYLLLGETTPAAELTRVAIGLLLGVTTVFLFLWSTRAPRRRVLRNTKPQHASE